MHPGHIGPQLSDSPSHWACLPGLVVQHRITVSDTLPLHPTSLLVLCIRSSSSAPAWSDGAVHNNVRYIPSLPKGALSWWLPPLIRFCL